MANPTNPNPQNPVPVITQQDLKDTTLFRLNSIISFLWTKVGQVFGGQSVDLKATINADVKSPGQTDIPTDNNSLITLGTALKLFDPKVMRTALVSGAWPLGQRQPLPSSTSNLAPLHFVMGQSNTPVAVNSGDETNNFVVPSSGWLPNSIVGWDVRADLVPVTSACVLDILKNGTSILGSATISIPVTASPKLVTGSAKASMIPGDVFRVTVLSADGSAGGIDGNIYVK